MVYQFRGPVWFEGGIVCGTKSFFNSLLQSRKRILLAGIAIISAKHLRDYVISKRRRTKWESAGKDVVVLHAVKRGIGFAHPSPFVLKVETYMRLAGIRYVYDTEVPLGSKGKMPWITLNGEDVNDSEFIIEHLKRKIKKDFSSHLSEGEKGVARAFQVLCDEHLIFGIRYHRFANGLKKYRELTNHIPWYVQLMLPPKNRRILWAQGFGRHTHEEKNLIIEQNIQAISVYLGSKDFFTGDEPCEVDCAIFGMLSQYLWVLPESNFALVIRRKYKNIEDYCERMKQRFYPDWENAAMHWEP